MPSGHVSYLVSGIHSLLFLDFLRLGSSKMCFCSHVEGIMNEIIVMVYATTITVVVKPLALSIEFSNL